jgi:hypothetical protein
VCRMKWRNFERRHLKVRLAYCLQPSAPMLTTLLLSALVSALVGYGMRFVPCPWRQQVLALGSDARPAIMLPRHRAPRRIRTVTVDVLAPTVQMTAVQTPARVRACGTLLQEPIAAARVAAAPAAAGCAKELRRALVGMGWKGPEADRCVAWLGPRTQTEAIGSVLKDAIGYLAPKGL